MKKLLDVKSEAGTERTFEAIKNISFAVTIGDTRLSFSKISNISREQEYETVREGGVNDRVFTLSTGKQQVEKLILERGVSNKRIKNTDLKLGEQIKKPVTIMILDQFAGKAPKVVRAYSFDEGVVTSWETNELDAMNGDIFIERFEISHSGLVEIKM
ncbi:phage tail protein [Aminipila terrae]|uniref:Uncharacterized protein n=1 Tax=Aminipila terrae TaxID=2697030 RepID=A0A6P1MLR4_9FIRM|nr:phage tail protein [Aminipila terrae]QHI72586.1 hypothetical protein Ami3637_09410 [Aminipila terrae]